MITTSELKRTQNVKIATTFESPPYCNSVFPVTTGLTSFIRVSTKINASGESWFGKKVICILAQSQSYQFILSECDVSHDSSWEPNWQLSVARFLISSIKISMGSLTNKKQDSIRERTVLNLAWAHWSSEGCKKSYAFRVILICELLFLGKYRFHSSY